MPTFPTPRNQMTHESSETLNLQSTPRDQYESPRPSFVLKREDHLHFLEHGYVVLRGLVPPDVVARASRELKEWDESEAGLLVSAGAGLEEPRPPNAVGCRAVDSEATQACVTEEVRGAVIELLGGSGTPSLVRGGLLDMRRSFQPDAEWSVLGLHVDSDYPTAMPNGWVLGMSIFLTEVRAQGGAFIACPGSHLRYRALMGQTSGSLKGSTAMPEHAGAWRELITGPGDVLLYHHLLGHSGSLNVIDPHTRHTLQGWWNSERRIAPGLTPFREMSTVEKSNSARYLHRHFDIEPPLPRCAFSSRISRVLKSGDTPTATMPPMQKAGARGMEVTDGGRLLAHAVIHNEGLIQRFFVEPSRPSVVCRSSSHNLVDWNVTDLLRFEGERVHSLSCFQWGLDVILVVCVDGRLEVRSSRDLGQEWELRHTLPDAAGGAAFYNSVNSSRTARGDVLFSIPAWDESRVVYHHGKGWHDLSAQAAIAFRGAPGQRLHDISVQPVLAEGRFALIADVSEIDGASDQIDDGADSIGLTSEVITRPAFVISDDSVRYPDPLRMLDFTAPTAPRQIRVFARAEQYWLVSYCRTHTDGDRLFWGSIDWQEPTPTLREINDNQALKEALFITGIR